MGCRVVALSVSVPTCWIRGDKGRVAGANLAKPSGTCGVGVRRTVLRGAVGTSELTEGGSVRGVEVQRVDQGRAMFFLRSGWTRLCRSPNLVRRQRSGLRFGSGPTEELQYLTTGVIAVLSEESGRTIARSMQRDGGAMTDARNDVVLAWHGVDGDTQTWWANTGEIPASGTVKIRPNQLLGIKSFVGPALDPSARLLAHVGQAPPSAITLRRADKNGDFSNGGDAAAPSNFQTDARPAVAVADTGELVLAWRVTNGEIWVSTHGRIPKTELPDAKWSEPVMIGTSARGPAVATYTTVATGTPQFHFLVAFQGDHNQIWGSIDARPINGKLSAPMYPKDGGMFTSHSPALCWAADRFWMAWKGAGDEKIWLSSRPTNRPDDWTAPRQALFVPGTINTIAGPGLAVCQADKQPPAPLKLVLAWRGVTGDQALWWSTRPMPKPKHEIEIGDNWEAPQKIDPSDNSNAGPSVGSRHVGTVD
jgi:hypothetical protein